MEQLSELLKQKKEIERKIKELKDGSVSHGRFRIDIEHYPTNRPDEWRLMILSKPIPGLESEKPRWRSLQRNRNKEDLINMIPDIIKELEELYQKCSNKEG